MNLSEIQELIKFVAKAGVNEVEIDFLKFNFKKTYCRVSNIRMNNLLLSKPNV